MTLDEKNTYLKALDPTAFKELGAMHVAYVREIDWLGGKHFSVHSADGSPLTIVSSRDSAMTLISSSDMEAISLH
jgi:hypothetical protein